MKKLTAFEIRELFIKFWESKGAKHLQSFSLVPDDPSLLFTIAGMVPLKPYYLGIKEPEYPRVVTCQKCVRTNDIENVGRTARHHTFFEMLGNFTWGSYFKHEAITWAWEFLTKYIELDPNRLYATIYKDDEEAYNVWRNDVGLPDEKIFRFGQDDNYWFMGETGPCGPCSEIYYDRGEKYSCGKKTCGVGCDCDRYMEIWNLVFTQFDRQKDGSLPLLPHKNIDTGMGLERLASVIQEVDTNYETDLFTPLIDYTCSKTGIKYGTDPKNDMAARVIADHIRAVAFMLADGVLPSNDGPGYVLRRLLRRAVRFGKLLGFEKNFLCEYLPILIKIMGDPYRELIDQRPVIENIINIEEEKFNNTLRQGTELFESECRKLKAQGKNIISGEIIFTLYDTYGFPPELTREMAEEQNLKLDEDGFKKSMELQRERARSSSKQKKSALTGDVYNDIENESGKTEFTGYENYKDTGKILALLNSEGRHEKITAAGEFEIVLDRTPFYAERGGEVGDTGIMRINGHEIKIINTVPHGNIIVHTAKLENNITISTGGIVECEVDNERRKAIRRNHTATHLLHEALGQILGRHVRQAGSLVTDEFLRFDFTHHSPVTDDEIIQAEKIVNEQILLNTELKINSYTRDEAQNLGAKALFEEKYGEIVRVVDVPGFSMELCGGLHVTRTGDIGSFKILREESIGSGTRRIFALTGMNVINMLQKLSSLKNSLTALLATDEENLQERAKSLVNEIKTMRTEIQNAKLKELLSNSEKFLQHEDINGISIETGRFPDVKPEMLRDIGDKARSKAEACVVILASLNSENACQLVIMANEKAVSKGIDSGLLVKEACVILGGKGGGRKNTAQGGGRNGENLDSALNKIHDIIRKSTGA